MLRAYPFAVASRWGSSFGSNNASLHIGHAITRGTTMRKHTAVSTQRTVKRKKRVAARLCCVLCAHRRWYSMT